MAGLYVHVPFRSVPRPHDEAYTVPLETAVVERYVDALCAEIKWYAQELEDPGFETLYVGGGRPSLLHLADLRQIISSLREHFDLSDLKESTVEVHPLDVSSSFVRALQTIGFTRLSIEALSFAANVLKAIDAPHTGNDTTGALHRIQGADFSSYTVDLLFGAPGQASADWDASLHRAVDLGVPHVTVMEWTDPDDANEADEEQMAGFFRRATELLEAEGYEAYELTHFARPGHASVHEQHLLAHRNQLGLGPSAHSFWWPAPRSTPTARRWTNVADVHQYAAMLGRSRRPVVAETVEPNRRMLAQEYVYLRLRTNEGLHLPRLATRYDVDLEAEAGDRLSRLIDEELLQRNENGRIRLTLEGRLRADGIIPYLFPAH